METRGLGQSQDIGGSIVSRHHRRRRVGTAKNGRRPTIVDLDKVTAEVLRTHRDHQRALAARLGISTSAKLFPRNDQVGWTHPNTVRYALRTLGKRAGCPSITLRSLRHFHASVALQAGQNPVVVSKRIGHSSPKITMDVYAHALSGWQQDAAEAFAEVMKPAA